MGLNVKIAGAVGDGKVLDHKAIQFAIDQCSSQGGGTVTIPEGEYLCGTLHMKPGVSLYLEKGAVIRGVHDSSLYPVISPTPFNNPPGKIQALIWFENVEGAGISGPGAIDGGYTEALDSDGIRELDFNPMLICCRNSSNLRFSDFTLKNSGYWSLHLLRCQDVMVRGITIANNIRRICTDGIDPDGCSNVIISDCNISTGDDCIVIKSTEGDMSENITITNCVLSTHCAALKIGTESIGTIRRITFNNCVIHGTSGAIALYMKDGGCYEDILFTNLIADTFGNFPVLLDITPRYYDDNPAYGQIRNIVFDNIIMSGMGRCLIEGSAGQPIENVAFRNITWNINNAYDFEKAYRPVGTGRTRLDPKRHRYDKLPYHIIASNTVGLEISNFKLFDRKDQPLRERSMVLLASVKEALISNPRPMGGKWSEEEISAEASEVVLK